MQKAGRVGGAAVVVACLLTGCATDIQPPSVSVLDVRLLSVGLLQQQSNLLLCVGNPSDRPLSFRRATFDVDVAGRPLAHGDSVVAVELPPHQAVPVPVALTSTTANLGSQLVGVLLTGGVDYRVTGRVTLKGLPLKVPFHAEGRLHMDAASRSLRMAPARGEGPSACALGRDGF